MPIIRYKRPTAIDPMIVPPATDPLFSSVALLLPLRADFNDHSPNARSLTNNGVVLSADQAKFGTQSAKFDNAYFEMTGANSLNLPGDFEIECWVYQTSRPTYFAPILETLDSSGFSFDLEEGKMHFFNGSSAAVGVTVILLNTWTFLQVKRINGFITLWVNGKLDFGAAMSTSLPTSGNFRIGANNWSTIPVYKFFGYIQDLRVTKAARPQPLPAAALPTA